MIKVSFPRSCVFYATAAMCTVCSSSIAIDLTPNVVSLGSSPYHSGTHVITSLTAFDGRLHYFTSNDSTQKTRAAFYNLSSNMFQSESIDLDAEYVRDSRVIQGNLLVSSEDEAADNNSSSGYLRTTTGWIRANVPNSNAHQQGQVIYNGRWFAGAAWRGSRTPGMADGPAMVYSDNATSWNSIGTTYLGSTYDVGDNYFGFHFFTYKGSLFVRGHDYDASGGNPERILMRVVNPSSSSPSLERVYATYRDMFGSDFDPAGNYIIGRSRVIRNNILFEGHVRGYVYLLKPQTFTGASGQTVIRPGYSQNVGIPDGTTYGTIKDNAIATRHGYAYQAIVINNGAGVLLRRSGDDGQTWVELGTVNASALGGTLSSVEIEIDDNGNLYLATRRNLYKIPTSVFGIYNPPNTVPTAVDDTFSVEIGSTLSITRSNLGLLGNDYDENEDGLFVTLSTNPTKGTLSLARDGTFSYTPFSGATAGIDQFQYLLSDGRDTTVGTAYITVIPEPTSIMLLGLTALGLRRRRSIRF